MKKLMRNWITPFNNQYLALAESLESTQALPLWGGASRPNRQKSRSRRPKQRFGNRNIVVKTPPKLIFGNKIDDGSPTEAKDEDWLTTSEAAEFLRLSEPALRNLTSDGHVPFYKLKRRNRYRKSELAQILLSERRGGYNGH